ncbi:MAG: hypothetical protein AUG89_00120 [Acidobacteria bacterium 13_1_20CM_4_56_7]|nr:MAG: hypothetical protein AUG89_00120 [Acidobacteria bacterium 13_1_20CM_4_56_7]
MAGHSATSHLDSHDRCGSFQKRNHQHSHDVKKCMLFFGCLAHVCGQRPHQAITQQDAQKSSHQCGRHLLANFFGRAAQSSHRDHHAQHGSHNAESRKRIGHGGKGRSRLARITVLNFEIEIEHLIQVERIYTCNRHAKRIADEIPNVMVLHERGILRKYCTLFRFFDVIFQGHQAVLAGLVEQVVHHFQRIDIGLLAELGSAENCNDSRRDLLDNVQWIGDQNGARGCAADNDQLRRLEQHHYVSVLHEISGRNAAEHHHDADNRKHANSPLIRPRTRHRPAHSPIHQVTTCADAARSIPRCLPTLLPSLQSAQEGTAALPTTQSLLPQASAEFGLLEPRVLLPCVHPQEEGIDHRSSAPQHH